MDIVSILKYHSEHQSKGGRGCISLYNSKALSHLTKLTKFYMSSHSQSLFRFPPTVSKTSLYSGCLWIEIQSTFTGFFLIFLFTNNKSHPRVCVCVCVYTVLWILINAENCITTTTSRVHGRSVTPKIPSGFVIKCVCVSVFFLCFYWEEKSSNRRCLKPWSYLRFQSKGYALGVFCSSPALWLGGLPLLERQFPHL